MLIDEEDGFGAGFLRFYNDLFIDIFIYIFYNINNDITHNGGIYVCSLRF